MDAPLLCPRRLRRVELRRPGPTTARDVRDTVLGLFAGMGAGEDDLAREKTRLCDDMEYFDEWCRTLPEWCPGVARYVEL